MVLKTDFHAKSLNCLLPVKAANSPLSNQQCFFTNHQKWQISRHLDCKTGAPLFHLNDPHGLFYAITEFIVEDLDPHFRDMLAQLNAADKQQELIHQYLQERLNQATPYQVNVERHDNKLVIRFGDYGLKGGVKIGEWETGKAGALFLSAGQIGLGMYLSVKGGNSGKFGGQALISSGLATGMYAYQTDEDKKKYEDKEYAKQFGYSLLTGMISGGFGKLALGANTAARIGWQFLGSIVGTATSTTVSEVIEKGKNADLKVIGMKTAIGGIGGVTGALTGALTNAALTSDNVTTGIALNTLKKMMESGVSSGSSKLVTSVCENLEEEDPAKKKNLRTLAKESFQSAVIGALISGIITALEQTQKIQEYNRTKNQIEQTQKDLENAKVQKAKSEGSLQDLQKTLEQSEKNLIEKQKILKSQEQTLHEKKLQQQQVQERIEKDQQSMGEAQKIAGTAEKELHVAQQALTEAQQQVDKHQQAISEAQKIASTAEQQLLAAMQTAQQAEQAHMQLVASIDKDVRRHLNRGYKAKINGHTTKNEEKIRNAYLQGGKIEWKKGRNRVFGSRETIRTKPSHLMEKYQQAQEHAKQTEQKIQALQSSINEKQTELKIVQDERNLHHQEVDRTQKEIKTAQEIQLKQTELKIAHDQLRSYQQEIQQTQQDVSDMQGAIKALEQQKSQFEAKLQEELMKLQEVLIKESGLTTLSKEQLEALSRAQQDYNKAQEGQAVGKDLHLRSSPVGLKNALKPEPVSYVEKDCSMEELIPHVVLVHALNHTTPPQPLEMGIIERIGNLEAQFDYYLEHMVRRDGTVGHHLQLKEREFQGSLETRPQIHWSWNQLVQPNGGRQQDGSPMNSWEEAQFAILEPLSTLENTIHRKPFGVAPYDTMTFDPHCPSDNSIILVSEPFMHIAKKYLPDFHGRRLIPFNGPLRSAVVDALQAHYPETWHICDEKGNLSGKKMQYSEGGYSSKTCIKRTDGQVIVLIEKSGFDAKDSEKNHKSKSITEYYRERRFIGLHINAVTFLVEDGSNAYFTTLKTFKDNHAIVKDHPLFAEGVKDIHALANLGALEALDFYQKSSEYDAKTGIMVVANYIIREAIYADLVSLFYQMNPDSKCDLSPLDLDIIISSCQIYLINLLTNIKTSMTAVDIEQKMKGWEFFTTYCSILKECLKQNQKAKEEASRLTSMNKEVGAYDKKNNVLCLSVAEEEWKNIEVPANTEFDLGKNWPLSDQLRKYTGKVLRTLPKNPEKLEHLHRYISSISPQEAHSSEEQKDRYRLNIICSVIQWALQESVFFELRNDHDGSILINKLLRSTGWMAEEYGLETEDYTQNIGDCLFDNVAAQFGMVNSQKLRQGVVQFMQEHSREYSERPDYHDNKLLVGDGMEFEFFNDWHGYLACMCKPQTWGTELEIHALASMLDSPIVLLTVGIKPKTYNPKGKNTPIFLHHVDGNHFDACIPQKGLTPHDIYPRFKN